MKNALMVLIFSLTIACSSSKPPATVNAPPPKPVAPWTGEKLSSADIPPTFMTEWKKAENRKWCALVAPADVGTIGEGARARRANFAGGWAVAFDKSNGPGSDRGGSFCERCGRSAYGIAGTGVEADSGGPEYQWELHREWSDGSSAGYGLEGGTGPKYLAYLRIHGQGCLYNVWSHLGREHLEFLLEQLRFVK